MDVKASLANGFSYVFVEYVKNGFPENWQFVLFNRVEVNLIFVL